MRQKVSEWLARPLERYYPIVFIDAIHVKVRRDTVSNEAFYVILGVTPQRRREVLGIAHFPSESATGWGLQLAELQTRGVEEIGLVAADGIPGLDGALSEHFSGTPLQWCTTHIKRNLQARVRSEDKEPLAEELRGVFRTDDPEDTPEAGWERWQALCTRWGRKYNYFTRLRSEAKYQNYDYRIRSMIPATSWIERLNRSFRRVLKMRLSMPNEESVLVLLGHVARNQRAYARRLPHMDKEETLFPQQNNSP